MTVSSPPYTDGPVATVAGVAGRLAAIIRADEAATAGGPYGGRYWFTRLYSVITDNVAAKIASGSFFDDEVFLGALLVAFGNRYFDAVRSDLTAPDSTPAVWRRLFMVAPGDLFEFQLAAAGVNAHVNLDLAVALVEGCRATDSDLDAAGHKADFDKVDMVFEEEMDRLLDELRPRLTLAEQEREGLLNVMIGSIIGLCRAHAWRDAEILWPLRAGSPAWHDRLRLMDRRADWVGEHVILVDVRP